MKEKKGIFIPFTIWTIKNLNINEKLILSDISNKAQLENFSGYTKRNETLQKELGLNDKEINEIFKSLKKKGYIENNPIRNRFKGQFKTVLSQRILQENNINNAERFVIPENNSLFESGIYGCFFSFEHIKWLNSWKEGDRKHKLLTKFLLLHILIQKVVCIDTSGNLFSRFTIKELLEFTGLSRQAVARYIYGDDKTVGLTEKASFNGEEGRILYSLSDKQVLEELQSIKKGELLEENKLYLMDFMGEIIELKNINRVNLYFINQDFISKSLGYKYP